MGPMIIPILTINKLNIWIIIDGVGKGVGIQDIQSEMFIIHIDHVSHVTDLFKRWK